MSDENVNEWGVETASEQKFELDQAAAEERASGLGIELTGEHLGVLKIIHQFLAGEEPASVRELTRALQEQFEEQGGKKHLYELFPGGPIHQGCQILGIEEPGDSLDLSFGSVH
jgi:tRNA 2-thiouridine synthesizing protein E